MDETEERDVPEGAAVFPIIPPELGRGSLLLAAVHALVFLAGSDEVLVNAEAADEAVETMAEYLQRLKGDALVRVHEDMDRIMEHASKAGWPKQLVHAQKLAHRLRVGGGR